jgi:hypothetical protein
MGPFRDKRFNKPSKEKQNLPTRFLYLSGVGDEFKTDAIILKGYLEKFGELDEAFLDSDEPGHHFGIYMPSDRRYSFIIYKDIKSAVVALNHIQSNPEITDLGISKVLVRYAEVTENKQPSQIEDTSVTRDVIISGLFLIENYIDEECEQRLMSEYGSETAPWRETLNRRVQVKSTFFLVFFL